jgi:hypothetical protein
MNINIDKMLWRNWASYSERLTKNDFSVFKDIANDLLEEGESFGKLNLARAGELSRKMLDGIAQALDTVDINEYSVETNDILFDDMLLIMDYQKKNELDKMVQSILIYSKDLPAYDVLTLRQGLVAIKLMTEAIKNSFLGKSST